MRAFSQTRRGLLAGIPFVGLTTAVPLISIATSAKPAQGAPESAHERMAFHLAEFKKAAEEIAPSINRWEGGTVWPDSRDSFHFTLYARCFEPWELARINGASPQEVNAIRVATGLEPFRIGRP